MLEEFAGANRVEHLVVAESSHKEVLIQADSPAEEALSLILRFQLREDLVSHAQCGELEAITLARRAVCSSFALFFDLHVMLRVGSLFFEI